MKAGAVDWLETPYEKDELLAAVASAIANIQRTTNESARGSPALRRIAGTSARERQVFDGLLAGGTNKTIGKQPGISSRTVEMHRSSVMERLGARTCPKPC